MDFCQDLKKPLNFPKFKLRVVYFCFLLALQGALIHSNDVPLEVRHLLFEMFTHSNKQTNKRKILYVKLHASGYLGSGTTDHRNPIPKTLLNVNSPPKPGEIILETMGERDGAWFQKQLSLKPCLHKQFYTETETCNDPARRILLGEGRSGLSFCCC